MANTEFAQLKAAVPMGLKRKAFAALALRGEPYNRWLCGQLEAFVQAADVESEWTRPAAPVRDVQPEVKGHVE